MNLSSQDCWSYASQPTRQHLHSEGNPLRDPGDLTAYPGHGGYRLGPEEGGPQVGEVVHVLHQDPVHATVPVELGLATSPLHNGGEGGVVAGGAWERGCHMKL